MSKSKSEMLEREITFDRVIRWVLVALGATAAVLLINRLSNVLLPFFIAWILAYMIYPFVLFLEKKCRLRYRVVSITAALLIVLAVIALTVFLVVPPIIKESIRMAELISIYFHDTLAASRRLLPELDNHQLHTVAAACGYRLKNHHHALADAEACAWIAREIL